VPIGAEKGTPVASTPPPICRDCGSEWLTHSGKECLDAEVARVVFGEQDVWLRDGKWTGGKRPWAAQPCRKQPGVPGHLSLGNLCRSCGVMVPRFSTDLAAAWSVVEHVMASTERVAYVSQGVHCTDFVSNRFRRFLGDILSLCGSEAATRICVAALQALRTTITSGGGEEG